MKRLVLRADGSSQIGIGHVMRCIAVSQMLKNVCDMSFAIVRPDQGVRTVIAGEGLKIIELQHAMDPDFYAEAHAVLLDGYWYGNTFVKQIKASGTKVVQIDDFVGKEFFSDLVMNHAIGADYSNSVFHEGGRLLAGSSYALLREEFLSLKYHPVQEKLRSVTVSMGGADPHHYTLKLLKAIQQSGQVLASVNILLGSAYPHMETLHDFVRNNPGPKVNILQALNAGGIIELLQNSSLFVCSASTVVYEALAVRVPIACFLTADNQQGIYDGLIKANCILGMGNISLQSDENLEFLMRDAFVNYNKAVAGVKNQEQLIDGHSGERVKEAIRHLWN